MALINSRAPLADGRSLATLIPNSRLVALDSANHILPCWATSRRGLGSSSS
jgi:hypothetical protein